MIKRFSIISSIAILAAGSAYGAGEGAGWEYDGELGSHNWGVISEDYGLCEHGQMQSPIDFDGPITAAEIRVAVDWSPSPLLMSNNGKTVQVGFEQGSNFVSGGETFNLLQVHFHTPSEHLFSNEPFPMVAHFVHASAQGKLAVLGILFEEGAANPEIQKLIDASTEVGADPVHVEGLDFDPRALLPNDLGVYRYMGSLTTPPCSEGVNWHVAQDAVAAHPSQISAMIELMGNNARPVQSINSRLIVAPPK